VLAAKSVPVTVAVIGDGESAVKAAVEACNAGPHIHVELFIKKQLHGARLHIPGEQLKREQIAMTAIDAERMKRSLAEAAAYPHSVTLQTLKDVEQLEAAGRLRNEDLHQIGRCGAGGDQSGQGGQAGFEFRKGWAGFNGVFERK